MNASLARRAPLSIALALLIVAAAVESPRSRGADAVDAEISRQIIVKTVLLSIEDAKLRKSGIPWTESANNRTGVRTALVEKENVGPLVEKLRAQGGKVFSEPKVMTLDGQEATVHTGGEVATRASWTDEETGLRGSHARLGFLKFGTTLTATPTVLSPSRVLLALTVEHGVPVGNAEDEDETSIPAIVSCKLSTEVVFKPRQAVVVSIPNYRESAEKKTPASSLVALVMVEPIESAVSIEPETGEVAALRDEVRDLRRQLARLSELVAPSCLTPAPSPREREHNLAPDISKKDWERAPAMPRVAPRTVERALAAEPVEKFPPGKERLVTKVYAVADLVVPVPDIGLAKNEKPLPAPRRLKTSDLFEEAPRAADPRLRAEFAPLVNLITSTIEPATWESRGGAGIIHCLEKNLSLVVAQTEAAHEQIAEMLTKLRYLQDHMLELEIHVISTSPEIAEKVGLDSVKSGLTLSAEVAKRVREVLQDGKQTSVIAAPRLTMFNKQLCEVETRLSENRTFHLVLCGSLGQEPEAVRLNLAVNPKDAADAVRVGLSSAVRTGETLVVDVTDQVGGHRETGVPMLEKLPHVDRLFKNVRSASSEKTLLFISPRVRIEPEHR